MVIAEPVFYNWQTDLGSAFMGGKRIRAKPIHLNQLLLYRTWHRAPTPLWLSGQNWTQGISLAEVYELTSPGLNSLLGNVSGRSYVGTDDNVLISGFIIGDVEKATVVVRALGPIACFFRCKPNR